MRLWLQPSTYLWRQCLVLKVILQYCNIAILYRPTASVELAARGSQYGIGVLEYTVSEYSSTMYVVCTVYHMVPWSVLFGKKKSVVFINTFDHWCRI